MAKLKTVGVREFRDHATTYLSGSDPIAVSKHGRVVGFYIPLERDEDEVQRVLARLGETVGQVLDETGLSEGELARMFDLRRRQAK
jgi:antitoxin (DNA-binding transcriptional repressor) of toxin-antitoxin stability system